MFSDLCLKVFNHSISDYHIKNNVAENPSNPFNKQKIEYYTSNLIPHLLVCLLFMIFKRFQESCLHINPCIFTAVCEII